jgi:serine/threonine-protein kinase
MPSLEPGLWFDDRYAVARPVGRGGMAEVYLAHDIVEARSVAVKMLLPRARASRDMRRRLEHEVEVASRIDHPNVTQVFGGGTAPGDVPYLVGEALEGETLRGLLRRERTVQADRLLPLLVQAALGLEAAHRQDVVHCDVKPGNLFLCGPVGEASVLKVFDFGLAQSRDMDLDLEPESIAGTLEYMAPEQVVGDPVDPRADIYGLGIVAFRALTGELPFDTTPTTRLLEHHLFSPVPPPSWLVDDLDPGLEVVVMSAVRKHPANRYASMLDFALDLGRAARGETVIGATLRCEPDQYVPQTELGHQTLKFFAQSMLPSPQSDPVLRRTPGRQPPRVGAPAAPM